MLPPAVDVCKTAFEQVRRQRRRTEPLKFSDIRWDSLDRFLKLGFPTTADKGWQSTDIRLIADTPFTMAAEPVVWADAARLAPFHTVDVFGAELVFVNGHYVPEISRSGPPEGALVEPLSVVLDEHPDYIDTWLTHVAPFDRPPFVALNTALFADGACILVPAGTVVDRPIHIRFISTGEADCRPAMSHPRVLVVLEAGSQATVVESYAGCDAVPYFTNTVIEIVLGDHAVLNYCKLQHEGGLACHIGTTYAVAGRGARASLQSVSLGGVLARHEVVAVLGGADCECAADAFYVADGRQFVDSHTLIEHVEPRTRSTQRSRGILADEARAVVDARLIVGANAHTTTARHMNRTLLLSEAARIDSASDVSKSAVDGDFAHGSIVRQLCRESASYASEHEVPLEEACNALVNSGVSSIVNRLNVPALRCVIRDVIRRRLDRRVEAGTNG